MASKMSIDFKQIVGGILTITMFVMLGNMIRREHFSSDLSDTTFPYEGEEKLSNSSNVADDVGSTSSQEYSKLWDPSGSPLNPCWTDKLTDKGESKGFVQFVLSHGPHFHFSQVADALVVAKYLGATLVLPQIKGHPSEGNSEFGNIYDVDKFMESISVVVEVVSQLPKDKAKTTTVVKVPHRVTEQYIGEKVEPIFKKTGSIILAIYYPSIDMKSKEMYNSVLEPVRCLGMYNALQFNSQIQNTGNEMLTTLARAEDGSSRKFVSIDLRMDILLQKGCDSDSGKSCFSAEDIAIFLRKIGLHRETAIYLTQSKWHDSLSSLQDIFPNIYFKESMVSHSEKWMSENSDYEMALDLYVCLHSDVFIPAISGMFYANIAGQRIASGRTQILVPTANVIASSRWEDFISRYVIDKSHIAYSCFC